MALSLSAAGWARVSLAFALTVAATEAQGPPGAPRPQFSARADLVTVDVSAFDTQGRPGAGLREEDFAVFVDGAPRKIATLAFYGVDSSRSLPAGAGADQSPAEAGGNRASGRRLPDAGEEAAASPDSSRSPGITMLDATASFAAVPASRIFVIVVDRAQIRAGEGQQALAAAARFVSSLPASDRVAAWTMTGKTGALDFGQRRDAVVRKIREAVGVYRPVGGPSAPGLDLVESWQRAEDTLRGLRALLLALAPLDGPKHLVLVTGGGRMDETNVSAIREVASVATASRVHIHALHVRPLPSAAARPELKGLHCECQDEAALSTGALAYELALLTGGFADRPSEGMVEGASFDRLARQVSAWYLLGFEPIAGDRDGRTHRIEVRLWNRSDVTVRARRTFHVEADPVRAAAPSNAGPRIPPPALEWNEDAFERAQAGLMPFVWLPEWLDTTSRFCVSPELGPDVVAVSRWDIARLQSMTQWLQWVQDRWSTASPMWLVPAPAAAALLHTAAFIAQLERGNTDPPFLHLNLADLLLSPRGSPVAPDELLHRQWFSVGSQWLLAYGRLGDALRLVDDGLREYPGDAGLHYLAGTLHERMASPLLDPYQYNDAERREREQSVTWSLERAVRAFSRALDLDATQVGARLHRARILDLQQRPAEARAEFETVLASSPPPEVAWLAHMFLGRNHERASRHEAAVEEYRAAVAILPSQSSGIALAHVLERSGQRAAARAQLRLLTPAPGAKPLQCDDGCDPWQQYDLVDRQAVGASIKRLLQTACATP